MEQVIHEPSFAHRRFALSVTGILIALVSYHFFQTVVEYGVRNRVLTNRPGTFSSWLGPAKGPGAANRAASARRGASPGLIASILHRSTATPTSTMIPTVTPTPTYTPTPVPTMTPTPTPNPGTKRSSALEGMAQIYIPSGKFKMGLPVRDGVIEHDNQPMHVVYLDAFWIGQTTVTNAQYARCVETGSCNLPCSEETNPHFYDPEYANHPVVYVTWFDAQQFCEWSGGRLPTEAEWERGAGRGMYPWGDDDPDADHVNVDNQFDGTKPVGSFPAGASLFGLLDMGGNVREWVADWYSSNYFAKSPEDNPTGPENGEEKALRGASWHDPWHYAKTHRRYKHVPGSAGDNRGFRCVYPP